MQYSDTWSLSLFFLRGLPELLSMVDDYACMKSFVLLLSKILPSPEFATSSQAIPSHFPLLNVCWLECFQLGSVSLSLTYIQPFKWTLISS